MDKKFNLKMSFSTSSFGIVFKNLSWVFFAVFLALLVFEGLEVESSISLVNQLNQTPQLTLPTKNSVDRIDFTTYNLNLQKVQGAQTFVPVGGITYDPFNGIGTPPASPPASSTPVLIPLGTSTPSQSTPPPTSPSGTPQ